MRTTIDMPDALFRKTKAVAALRGSSMKELIIHAVERELANSTSVSKRKRVSYRWFNRGQAGNWT